MERMKAEAAFYTIRVDGHLGDTALSAFPSSLAAEHQVEQTVLAGFLDHAALYGVLSQLEMLGLDLVEVSRAEVSRLEVGTLEAGGSLPPTPCPDARDHTQQSAP